MEAAVNDFRTKMALTNRSFIDARIAEQRARATSEADRVSTISHFWFRWSETHTGWQRAAPPGDDAQVSGLAEQTRLEAQVQTLEDVAALPHYLIDGTQPPVDEATLRRFLVALENVVNDNVDDELFTSDERIELSTELKEFLIQTNGVYDLDFRHSGICDFSPLYVRNESAEVMYNVLNTFADREEWSSMGIESLDEELEVATGVLCGQAGQWPDLAPEYHDNRWFSLYLYCRPIQDQDNEEAEDEDWAWRVVFYNKKTSLDYKLWSFSSIPKFLEWYATWEERLDDEDVQFAKSAVRPQPPGIMGESGPAPV